ncbi:MAG: Phospholipase D [Chlamydiae bacterium]|nr:Phospholipase D [Chlamydiota bacterium]NGX47352.1 Phospholipase D [Chlamydiota bacterium]
MQMKILKIFFLLLPALIFSNIADCKVYFSPKDQLADRLIELIDREEKSIKIAIYSMTHLGIAKALEQARLRKVAIEVLVDPFSVKARSSIQRLTDAKIPLFVWDQGIRMGTNKRKGLMHDKFCIFGDHTVWTGSFNFTNDANLRHQENAITLESKEIAKEYLTQFSHMKLYESRPYQEYIALYPKKKRGKKALKSLS